jgi:hypothetical protein
VEINDYKILTSHSETMLEEIVIAYLNEGYELVGGPFTISSQNCFAQAVYRNLVPYEV